MKSMDVAHAKHKCFPVDPKLRRKFPLKFMVKHYAGKVVYDGDRRKKTNSTKQTNQTNQTNKQTKHTVHSKKRKQSKQNQQRKHNKRNKKKLPKQTNKQVKKK